MSACVQDPSSKKDDESWRDVGRNVAQMDTRYEATFRDWLQKEDNVSAIVNFLQRIANEYPLDRIINALQGEVRRGILIRELTSDWSCSQIAQLITNLSHHFWSHRQLQEIFLRTLVASWSFCRLSEFFSHVGTHLGLDYRVKVAMLQQAARRNTGPSKTARTDSSLNASSSKKRPASSSDENATKRQRCEGSSDSRLVPDATDENSNPNLLTAQQQQYQSQRDNSDTSVLSQLPLPRSESIPGTSADNIDSSAQSSDASSTCTTSHRQSNIRTTGSQLANNSSESPQTERNASGVTDYSRPQMVVTAPVSPSSSPSLVSTRIVGNRQSTADAGITATSNSGTTTANRTSVCGNNAVACTADTDAPETDGNRGGGARPIRIAHARSRSRGNHVHRSSLISPSFIVDISAASDADNIATSHMAMSIPDATTVPSSSPATATRFIITRFSQADEGGGPTATDSSDVDISEVADISHPSSSAVTTMSAIRTDGSLAYLDGNSRRLPQGRVIRHQATASTSHPPHTAGIRTMVMRPRTTSEAERGAQAVEGIVGSAGATTTIAAVTAAAAHHDREVPTNILTQLIRATEPASVTAATGDLSFATGSTPRPSSINTSSCSGQPAAPAMAASINDGDSHAEHQQAVDDDISHSVSATPIVLSAAATAATGADHAGSTDTTTSSAYDILGIRVGNSN
ncbi:hypothetical protein EV182_000696 [Spiromyces aspiralis]|uniref:Uncharacterized protein n=1 Tax=Spiromyces aspiralis TaxID=68401 RepID=A0ACC1HY76_9FUNG|nr:hypothetical protein EV182_000696 [Spiromyces aspiralis]